uniref:Uncharacterized protein n=1 Tax=Rhizophora mucronata TaxID=61149 RepID=A0A2P2P000_RHIMU
MVIDFTGTIYSTLKNTR